jgi:hypothetical protein
LTHTDTQWRTGIHGASGHGFAEFRTIYIGLDYTPIIKMAESLDIPLSFIFYEKLKAYETTALNIITGTATAPCTEKERQRCAVEYGKHFQWTCEHCEKNPKVKENA